MDAEVLREQIEAELGQLCAELDVPGASVHISCGAERVDAASGVINTRTRVPVTTDTLFQIQSITKIFTATMVMQLVDEGLLGLDDLVQQHLPEFRTSDPAASRLITIRHLLTHTGGFEGDLWQPTTSGDDALDRFVQDLVSQARQYGVPGRRFSYCNAGFGTLARIVEVVRAVPYEQALRHYLAEPLGIEEIAFSADQALAFRSAIGHVRPEPAAPLQPVRHWALMPPSNPAAGNQLAMSARALARLGRVFVSQDRSPNAAKVLSEASIAEMLRPQLKHRPDAPTPTEQGLGWRLPRPLLAEHGGGAPGTVSMLMIVPDRELVLVVLTNADSGATLARRLLESLLTNLAQISPPAALPVPGSHARVADPARYEGRYETRQTIMEITSDSNGRLWQLVERRNDELVMAERAGFTLTVSRHEIRPLNDSTFIRLAATGQPVGVLTFLDPDAAGRYSSVADDRVASR